MKHNMDSELGYRPASEENWLQKYNYNHLSCLPEQQRQQHRHNNGGKDAVDMEH